MGGCACLFQPTEVQILTAGLFYSLILWPLVVLWLKKKEVAERRINQQYSHFSILIM